MSSCQLAACRLVQAREPASGIIVIDVPTGLDHSDAINNFAGLVEFKKTSVKWSRLEFGCARIRSAICGSVNLILVVGFIGHFYGSRLLAGFYAP
jgi:hypothetical protein